MRVDLGMYLPAYAIPEGTQLLQAIKANGSVIPQNPGSSAILHKLAAVGLLEFTQTDYGRLYRARAGVTL